MLNTLLLSFSNHPVGTIVLICFILAFAASALGLITQWNASTKYGRNENLLSTLLCGIIVVCLLYWLDLFMTQVPASVFCFGVVSFFMLFGAIINQSDLSTYFAALILALCAVALWYSPESNPAMRKPKPTVVEFTEGVLKGCKEYHANPSEYRDTVIRCPALDTVKVTSVSGDSVTWTTILTKSSSE